MSMYQIIEKKRNQYLAKSIDVKIRPLYLVVETNQGVLCKLDTLHFDQKNNKVIWQSEFDLKIQLLNISNSIDDARKLLLS